jgi:transcriptional regulator with XRE-family HTH domain
MRHPRPLFAARRRSRGLTQEELAYNLGVDRSTVARWEAGDSEPQPWIRRKLARSLGVSTDDLAKLLTARTAGLRSAGDLERRRAGAFDVAALCAQLDAFAGRYETEPSAALLVEAGQCHAALRQLLDDASGERERRKVHLVATTSSILLSQLIWDASGRRDVDAALAFCDEAIAHAGECDDSAAAAHAELRKSYVALYSMGGHRDPALGLATAQVAAERSASVSQALLGLAHLHIAEALAMQGEYRRCERSLGLAEVALGQMRDDDPAADVHAPSQFDRMAGSCYLALGAPERAEPILARVADELHGRQKTRSLVLGNLALSHLRQRHLDGATAALHHAIDLLETSRGGGGMSVVFGAARELYPWRDLPAVQDVHDRLLGLMARS